MNAGEAIGLLVGLGEPESPDTPMLLQEWSWVDCIAVAIDKSADEPELRVLVLEAIDCILDLPKSKPGEAHEEVIRRRGFNDIRKGARRG